MARAEGPLGASGADQRQLVAGQITCRHLWSRSQHVFVDMILETCAASQLALESFKVTFQVHVFTYVPAQDVRHARTIWSF